MSGDLPIRRVTIAEQARAAAARFIATGETERNPHEGTADAAAWSLAFVRWVSELQAAEGSEASA